MNFHLNKPKWSYLPGVADGVGGWRDYGVDPSQFSGTLMKTCERLVKEGRFVPSNPVGVLTTSYYELLQNKVPLLGECRRCQLSSVIREGRALRRVFLTHTLRRRDPP